LQILGPSFNMRRPECNAFRNSGNDLAVVRLALLEGEFQADLIVLRTAFGKGLQQRLWLDATLGVEFGSEGAVAALIHEALLDVDDGRNLRHRPRPRIGVVVVR